MISGLSVCLSHQLRQSKLTHIVVKFPFALLRPWTAAFTVTVRMDTGETKNWIVKGRKSV